MSVSSQTTVLADPGSSAPASVAPVSPPPAPAAPQRFAQNTAGRPLEAATATDAAAVPAPTTNIGACDKPDGMGLSRVVEIDTTGGPGFGFEHSSHTTSCAPTKSC